ncbi:Tex-like N-terminal domain-containing protein, partial [Streptomyces sp. BE282]|uniref:Tex-like N-terminal domain-containing protein n=1 Tax=Streptomyces sp. BE282 TaxID=3002527 RepID=UPI002E77D106
RRRPTTIRRLLITERVPVADGVVQLRLEGAQLRTLEERLRYLRELDERRTSILESVREQGKLDEALEAAIREHGGRIITDPVRAGRAGIVAQAADPGGAV